MADPIPIKSRPAKASPDRAARILEAIEDCREISERARAQGSGMVIYPVTDIELLLEALAGRG